MKVVCVFLTFCVSTVWLVPSNLKIKSIPLKDAGSRIINGYDAAPGIFPWQAAIFIEAGITSFCGGTLIDPEWLLTAGHCVSGATNFSVRLGSDTIEDPDENRIIIETSEFYLHPGFSEDTLINDIGLIKIPAVKLNPYIKTIPLAAWPLGAGTDLIATGFGKTNDSSTTISNQLKYVKLRAITNEECARTYGNTITDGMVCAVGNTIENTCEGDDGGPVTSRIDGNIRHVAIPSFVSKRGCELGLPSGYTRTFFYLDWIKATTGLDL